MLLLFAFKVIKIGQNSLYKSIVDFTKTFEHLFKPISKKNTWPIVSTEKLYIILLHRKAASKIKDEIDN